MGISEKLKNKTRAINAREIKQRYVIAVSIPATILEYDLSEIIDNQLVKNKIIEYRSANPASMGDYDKTTNIKTWHSFWNTQETTSLFDQEIQQIIDVISSSTGLSIEILDFWINMYEKNSFAVRHKHSAVLDNYDPIMSAVYFVESDENSAPIVFDDNRFPPTDLIIVPKPGMLLVFPGEVYHRVDQNKSDNRTSFAFNFKATAEKTRKA